MCAELLPERISLDDWGYPIISDQEIPDDADMEVRDERQRAAAGALTAVEHDRAGLGDRERAAAQHAVQRIELQRAEIVVDDELEPVRTPRAGERHRHAEPPSPVFGAG